jgi:predicted nucleotidyltransferase component of viral defense system
MRKDFVNEVATLQKVKRADLIEKDLILHQVLFDLSKNKYFHDNFAFKGGTCLAKCYLDYFRFSEDIDFTWKDQSIYQNKSQKELRKQLSSIIDEVGKMFEDIAKKRDLSFQSLKQNRDYVELTGSDKMCTFKIWYESEVLGRKSFLKVQINFVEKICYSFRSAQLRSLLRENSEELMLLFPEFKEYNEEISFDVYDAAEILSEKIRAILTRQGTKSRDYLDVYLIEKQFGIPLDDVRACVLEKTQFTLNLYERYRQNLEEKKQTILSTPFNWGEEKGLLLKEIDEKDFYKFIDRLKAFLKKVMDNLPN